MHFDFSDLARAAASAAVFSDLAAWQPIEAGRPSRSSFMRAFICTHAHTYVPNRAMSAVGRGLGRSSQSGRQQGRQGIRARVTIWRAHGLELLRGCQQETHERRRRTARPRVEFWVELRADEERVVAPAQQQVESDVRADAPSSSC